jgi:arabinogalactan oligomer/maltooligosaccharide transport system permease protein
MVTILPFLFTEQGMRALTHIGQLILNRFKAGRDMVSDADKITKLALLIMGLGHFLRRQWVKGFVLLGAQLAFVFFMITSGLNNLIGLSTLGTRSQERVWSEARGIYVVIPGDNSMLFLLFGVATVFIVLGFLALYWLNFKGAYTNQKTLEAGKVPLSFKAEVGVYLNEKYHITVLALPILLTFLFTIVPLVFMILIAFTNFDRLNQPPGNLFTWVGFTNFTAALWQDPLKSRTFFALLSWTLTWAVLATGLNYVFGMVLAIMINKKGIQLKRMWRTIFVITIAVPQFVSLLLMSQLLADLGTFNVILRNLGLIDQNIRFLTDPTLAKITVVVVNLWVGVPYSMLITSGILMNIPTDLYESARIDGASAWVQFWKITIPYMLFVTGPYLITQFIGNINNFNVIFLLTGGGPLSLQYFQAGQTDLLVTWLYKLTVNEQNYSLASTIGIFIFMLSAFFSLVIFNKTTSLQQEEDFQ